MNRAADLREIAATAARAAAEVPGVAYLSPRLTDRLRPTARSAGHHLRATGVRVTPRDASDRTTVDISLAVHTGHQATAVARQVRVAVIESLHADHPRVWSTDVTVSVTVTAIV
jgi:uncharacterized alkaline shock family protein YloU